MAASNFLVSYDIGDPDDHRNDVHQQIEDAGDAELVNDSFWYVKSSLQLTTLRDRIWAAMDANRDSLVVVDASGNDFEAEGITFDKHQFMKTEWYK